MIDSVNPERGASPTDLKGGRRKKLSLADPSRVDRLPPHSIEAEQGIFGCILLSPNDCMGECIERFKAGAGVFYDIRHQALYDTLAAMYETKEPIDLITLQQRLKDKQQLEGVGGLAY